MVDNPYQAPQTDLSVTDQPDVPEDILQKIKYGWIAAIISGLITLAVMLFALSAGIMENLVDLWTSLDVIVIFALAFGIYKKSRIAATTMFWYFLASKIWLLIETGRPSGILISVIFLYFYYQAMVGTFQYHKLIKRSHTV